MKRCFGLALLLSAAAGMAAADAGSCTLAARLVPGQVVAYDGTYQLRVPPAKNSQSLLLAWIGYGLILKVEEVDGRGAVIAAAYDRLEYRARQEPATPGWAGLIRGQTFRFRLTPNGRIQEAAGGTWSPDLGALADLWPGWPEGPVSVGGTWRVESRLGLAAGGELTGSREYRLRELAGQAVAHMDYIERAELKAPAEAAGQQGWLEGSILGVGQVRFDLTLGLVERASSISVFEGAWRAGEASAAAGGRIRLEIENTLVLRQATNAPDQLPSPPAGDKIGP